MSMRSTEPNVNLLVERTDSVFGAGGPYVLPKPGQHDDGDSTPTAAVVDEIDPDADEILEMTK
jgi:hypothetical protein